MDTTTNTCYSYSIYLTSNTLSVISPRTPRQILHPPRALWSFQHHRRPKATPPPHAIHPRDRELHEYRSQEENNVYYRRVDFSVEHSIAARRAFLSAIASPSTINLSEAALQIAAEDDALVSHSAVPLPVDSFRRRLEKLANEIERIVLPPLLLQQQTQKSQIVDAILSYFYTQQKFKVPVFGRSVLLNNAVIVTHPGVWEKPNKAYITDALITKQAVPAVLAIILSDILRRLLVSGSIDFWARVDYGYSLEHSPTSVTIVPGITREMAVVVVGDDKDAGNTVTTTLSNTTTDALAESLCYLARSYWPFPWEERNCNGNATVGVGGGFRGAALEFLDGGAASAEAEAIARTAKHRLERGIWTSPGAGDVRRAIAAMERLVILLDSISRGSGPPTTATSTRTNNDMYRTARRDLAVLYCHVGRLEEAYVEMKAYVQSRSFSAPSPSFVLTPGVGISIAGSRDERVDDVVLEDRLMMVLGQVERLATKEKEEKEKEGGAVARRSPQPLSIEEAERRCEEELRCRKVGERIAPLTW